MALFALLRTIDPATPETEKETITMRAIGGTQWYPGVSWVRSFVDPVRERTMCIYEAPTPDLAGAPSVLCRVPLDEVRPVVEYIGDDYVAEGLNVAAPEAKLYLITRNNPPDITDDELGGAVLRSAHCLNWLPGMRWVRSFFDEERKRSYCIYRAPDEEMIRSHAHQAVIPCDEIQEVEEQIAADFGEMYESFGMKAPLPVPRS